MEFENFRKHSKFRVTRKERNIFVGPNNAGKSSVLDALRLFADVARYAEYRLPILKTQNPYGVCATYEMTNKNFCLPIANIPTNESEEDVKVSIYHDNGSALHLILNADRQPTVFLQSEKRAKSTKAYFKQCFPESIIVVPTLSQLEETEKPNDLDYVRSVEHTRLAARNFRNIWRQKSHSEFQDFSALVEGNWKDIEVQKPKIIVGVPSTLEMIYLENGYPREIYLSGFGFQAWMQIMTHFLRGSGGDILVLDEPDVYLHADLQRRLYGIAKKRFSQILLATHSAEIMNEANSGDVVLVRSEFQTGKRITTEEGYRSAHALLGSSENADFARLSRAKRIIAFEGNDRSIYRRFEQMLISDGVFSDPDTMLIKIGGYEQWPRVGNLPWAFQELFGIQPKIAAIFDRDYRCLEEIEGHEQKLRKSGVFCHVLRRKEIENYVIARDAICKATQKAAKKKEKVIEDVWIDDLLSSISLEFREDCLINVQSSTSKFYQLKRDGRDTQTILKLAKSEFDKDRATRGFGCRISGKEFFSAFNRALDEAYGVSISLFQVLDEFHASEFDAEFCDMLTEVNRYFAEE
ncbi:AAA family ATPase [Mesorhizobium sp. LjNodule214]